MKVEVRLFAHLRDQLPKTAGGVTELDLPTGARSEDILEQLTIPRDQPLIVMVNGRRAQEGALLQDGDRVGIFPPVGGG